MSGIICIRISSLSGAYSISQELFTVYVIIQPFNELYGTSSLVWFRCTVVWLQLQCQLHQTDIPAKTSTDSGRLHIYTLSIRKLFRFCFKISINIYFLLFFSIFCFICFILNQLTIESLQ